MLQGGLAFLKGYKCICTILIIKFLSYRIYFSRTRPVFRYSNFQSAHFPEVSWPGSNCRKTP